MWAGVQQDRRSGVERRTARHIQLSLPIRIRCDSPGLQFVEVTRTLTASRDGASFISKHPLREGMTLSVAVPYSEGDSMLWEKRARVVRAQSKDGDNEVGIEFLH